jgi:putative oxidoreductase
MINPTLDSLFDFSFFRGFVIRIGWSASKLSYDKLQVAFFKGGFAMTFFQKLLSTNAPAAVILICLIVGVVFLEAGIQKFPDARGVAAFTKIGIPAPEIMAPFVALFEIGCGTLVLLGLFTRFAAIPLIIVMLVAIATTKVPILLQDGFWKMAHEARLDYAILLGSIFLLVVGAGPWSFDARISRKDGL